MTKKNSAFSTHPSFLNRLAALLAPADIAVLNAGRDIRATTAKKAAPKARRTKIGGTPVAAGL